MSKPAALFRGSYVSIGMDRGEGEGNWAGGQKVLIRTLRNGCLRRENFQAAMIKTRNLHKRRRRQERGVRSGERKMGQEYNTKSEVVF